MTTVIESGAAVEPGLAAPVDLGTQDLAVSLRAVNKRFLVRRDLREALRHPFRRTYQTAVRRVTVDIPTGEFFGLLGPNGAGKTTLFKILSTFVTPDSGTVHVSGVDACAYPSKVRSLLTPVIADERSLRWRLDARENLRLYAALYGVPRRETDRRVADLLDTVGLSHTGAKLVGTFSTGMKQRLLIARALIPKPRILLLDEPTRGLDPLLARTFRAFLKDEVGRRQGCTILLATHNAEEAFELCDRVAVLNRGHLLVAGPTHDLREEFGQQRYRLWTRTPSHPAFSQLEQRGIPPATVEEAAGGDEWKVVELELAGGGDLAADVMRFLVSEGVVLARFERVGTSLADLIERVVSRFGSEADG